MPKTRRASVTDAPGASQFASAEVPLYYQLAGVLRGALFIWRKVGPEFEEAVSAWYRSRPEAWRKGVVGPASRIGFVSEAEIVAGAEAAAELVRTVAVKGWRDPKLGPMTPPFRSAIVLSHVLR